MRLLAVVACLWALAGCSSDAVDPPEPTLETPGSFVAREVAPNELHLFLILGALRLDNGQTMLLMRRFAPRPSNWVSAKELAQQPNLPIDLALTYSPENEFVTSPYRVVWFRTLTEQERDAIH